MTILKLPRRWLCVCVVSTLLFPSMMNAQTTKISTEYLMTLYAPLEAAQEIDSSLYVYNVRPGGWVKGPRINGTLLAPGGDWEDGELQKRFVREVRYFYGAVSGR